MRVDAGDLLEKEGFEFVLKLLALVVRLQVVDNAYTKGVVRGNG